VRVLVIGTGGVGSAVGPIAQRRSFFERMTFADLDPARAQALVDRLGEPDRFGAAQVDASDAASIAELARAERADAVLNAVTRASTRGSSRRCTARAACTSTWR
jgi:saccharopine dehydrogenase (NAD+, L-lysine-forming)